MTNLCKEDISHIKSKTSWSAALKVQKLFQEGNSLCNVGELNLLLHKIQTWQLPALEPVPPDLVIICSKNVGFLPFDSAFFVLPPSRSSRAEVAFRTGSVSSVFLLVGFFFGEPTSSSLSP